MSTNESPVTGTTRVKRGMAEMLKGGVIMGSLPGTTSIFSGETLVYVQLGVKTARFAPRACVLVRACGM